MTHTMKFRGYRVLTGAMILAAACVILSGCEHVRKLTYPEDFNYMEDKEVKQIMHSMSQSMARLGQLVGEASPTDKDKQALIVKELSTLDGYATRLSGGYKPTNQFVIADHIQGFSGDLTNARMLASLDPPRYDKAKNIVSSCSKCHEYR